jgi:hypothetical protein
MFKGLSLSLVFIALPTFAAPQLLTEIKAGDVWLQSEISQFDSDIEYKNPNNGLNTKESYTEDSLSFTSRIAIDTDLSFTPLFGFKLENEDGDENTQLIKASVGGIKKTSKSKTMTMLVSYENSDNVDETRSSFEVDSRFQTSDVTSQYYNEVMFTLTVPKDEGGSEGGSTLIVSDTIKFSVNPMMDVALNAGITLFENETLTEDQTKIKFDPLYLFGAKLAFNLAPEFTLSLTAVKGFNKSQANYTSGTKVDLDQDASLLGVSFFGRF